MTLPSLLVQTSSFWCKKHFWCKAPWMYTPEQIRQGRATLNDLARAAGRDPKSLEVVAVPVPADRDVIRQYEDAGADAAVVFMMPATPQAMREELEQIAQNVLR